MPASPARPTCAPRGFPDVEERVPGPNEAPNPLLARLPGLGPRSARKAALSLIKRRAKLLVPLAEAMTEAARRMVVCRGLRRRRHDLTCTVLPATSAAIRTLMVGDERGGGRYMWALERAGVDQSPLSSARRPPVAAGRRSAPTSSTLPASWIRAARHFARERGAAGAQCHGGGQVDGTLRSPNSSPPTGVAVSRLAPGRADTAANSITSTTATLAAAIKARRRGVVADGACPVILSTTSAATSGCRNT